MDYSMQFPDEILEIKRILDFKKTSVHRISEWNQWKLKVKMLVTQSRPTLCDSMDCSPPGSSVHGILQARILEWDTIPFCRGSSWPRDRTQVSSIEGNFFIIWATREAHSINTPVSHFSHVWLCATAETAAHQAPPSLDSPGKNTGMGCHFLLQCMKVKMKVKSLNRVQLLATPWTTAYQAPPSLGFSRQEYWSGGAIAFSA